MKDEIIRELGANYNTSDSQLLDSLIYQFTALGSTLTHLERTDCRLYPYIKKAVKSEYLCRGAEGLNSRSEGSISASYTDIMNTFRQDLIKGGLRRCY